jgi:flagellar basal body P-ring formation protein FlgA
MPDKYRFRCLAIACAVLLLSTRLGVARAEEIQDQAAIRAAIQTAMASRFAAMQGTAAEAEVGAIDSRLRLPACSNIVVDLPPANTAMMTAKVSCQAPDWTLYVPVRLHAWVNAVVASTNIPPNTKLTTAVLSRGRADALANDAGLITDPRQVEGKILRVGLVAGSPILSPLLDLPIAVRRGQKVMLTLNDNEMTIKTTATALEDGRVGDSISVENQESQKTLRATVARDGGVEINF